MGRSLLMWNRLHCRRLWNSKGDGLGTNELIPAAKALSCTAPAQAHLSCSSNARSMGSLCMADRVMHRQGSIFLACPTLEASQALILPERKALALPQALQ